MPDKVSVPEVSVPRLYLMRCMYLLNCVLLGTGVGIAFIQRQRPWEPVPGVAFSFWAALGVLSALGVRYPLAMLPLLFMQLLYKLMWLVTVYMPLRAVGRSPDLAQGMVIGIVLDVIAIPWTYVVAQYLRRAGDRWR